MRELLAARSRRVRDVWIVDGQERSDVVDEILSLATALRVPVRTTSRDRFEGEARTDGAQGVLAHADALVERDLNELCAPGSVPPFLVVLEGVTDPHNLGAVLRTAECGGATGAVLPRHRAAHVTPAVTKAAAGALEHLPIAVVAGVASALPELAGHGVWSVGLEAAAETSLFELDLAAEPIALVLGSEGRGLSRLSRSRCDVVASIPQSGSIQSLNVAAAAAVACFEIARRRARR